MYNNYLDHLMYIISKQKYLDRKGRTDYEQADQADMGLNVCQ